MLNKIFLILFAFIFIIKVNKIELSQSPSEIYFDTKQDIVFEVPIDFDQTLHLIEVFKSNLNDRIIQSGNKSEFTKLQWFSVGVPCLVEKRNDQNSSIISFNTNGFYILIDLLTNEHRNKIVEEIKLKYNLTVRPNQINRIKADKFECKLEVNCNKNNETNYFRKTFLGKVKDFTKNPFRVQFELNKKNDEKCIKQNQQEELEFYCKLSTISKIMKINKLTIESSMMESLNIEDELFGNADLVYVNRKQLANLASNFHSSLNIVEEYQIEEKEFSEKFIEEFISQVSAKTFEKVPIDEAMQHLSSYSTKDIQPNQIFSELSKVLQVKNEAGKEYISSIKENSDERRESKDQSTSVSVSGGFGPFSASSSVSVANKNENEWKQSNKNANEQLSELNKANTDDIEWKIDGDKIVPKSLNQI